MMQGFVLPWGGEENYSIGNSSCAPYKGKRHIGKELLPPMHFV